MSGAYDLAVIGAGSAGFAAAIAAAEMGARVALIGHGPLGGTCVNIGCVPSKTLIRAVDILHGARAADRFAGIAAEAAVRDWAAVIGQKDELVADLRRSKYADLLPAYDSVTHVPGTARFDGAGCVAVNGEAIAAGKVIVATGARPAVPALSGIADVPYLTSTTALDVETLPRSLLVLGGGYVGAELAQMFARAGTRVTMVFRSRLLPEAEPEISAALAGYLAAEGIRFQRVERYLGVSVAEGRIELAVTAEGARHTLGADRLLLAAGRMPNSEDLGLAEAGIACRDDGAIQVDDFMRSTRPGVYAAGDVTGRDPFVYMAAYGARIAAANALHGDKRRYDAGAMPVVVFTDPQLASVGVSELTARRRGLAIRTAVLGLEHVPRARTARDTRGLVKLVAEAGSGRLLGAHLLAPEAGDSIQTAALAIGQGLSVDALAEMIFPYLTTVEALKLAAQSFAKDVSKLSCCAG